MSEMTERSNGPDPVAGRAFIVANARILERRRAEFALGSSEGVEADTPGRAAESGARVRAVLAALEAYRNADGGFGHGLEADAQAPESQPLHADVAFEVLEDLVRLAPAALEPAADAARRTLPFLASVAVDGGLPIVLPSVAGYPRAEHWGDGDFPPGLNPTATIVGRARLLGLEDPWLGQAGAYCRNELAKVLDGPDAPGMDGAHTALCVLAFLEAERDLGPDRERAARWYAQVGGGLADTPLFQPMPTEGYGLTPLDFAPSPDSPRRGFFTTEQIEAHLDVLAAQQQADGGWPITWQAPTPAAELGWRAVRTLGSLRVLEAYGWIKG